jgi:hypothetical protein
MSDTHQVMQMIKEHVVHQPLISPELASALARCLDGLRDFSQRTTAVTRFSPTEIMR